MNGDPSKRGYTVSPKRMDPTPYKKSSIESPLNE